MKKKEKEIKRNINDYIDNITEWVLGIIKKLGKLTNNKKTYDTVFIFTRILITFMIIALLYIPFNAFGKVGVLLIYMLGSTFRGILSFSWSAIVQIAYCSLSLIILLDALNRILNNKELNFIEDNRRKDTALKKKIFLPIIKVVSTILYLFTIPFIVLAAIVLMLFGALLALLVHGFCFASGFIILIGIIVMIVATICAIGKVASGGDE